MYCLYILTKGSPPPSSPSPSPYLPLSLTLHPLLLLHFFFSKGQTSQECQPAMIYQVAEYTYFKLLKYHIDKTTINKYFRSL